MVVSMQRWKGKVAIVTGASSGIGAATAIALVKEGLIVVGIARRVEKIQELSKTLTKHTGKLHAIKCDLAKEEDIKAAFQEIKKIGPVHILINNAAQFVEQPLIDGDVAMWRSVVNINLLGLCIATQEAIKDMKANGVDGHVIHISSMAGSYVPQIPNLNIYPATKFGVCALTETMRQELVRCKSKIKISCISPGAVESDMSAQIDLQEATTATATSDIPFLKPEDIADSIVHVLSTPPHVQIHQMMVRPVGEAF